MRSRRLSLGFAGLLLAAGPGCEFMKRQNQTAGGLPDASGALQDRPAGQFVSYLNRQAGLIQSVRYDDVSLRASEGGNDLPRLTEGTLACAPPRHFRLMSGHFLTSGSEVDVGSNPSEFWMYVKRPEPTYVFCGHDDFAQGKANLPVPFEPAWVLEALGLQQYDPNAEYAVDLDQKNGLYTLSSPHRSTKGEGQKKIVVFTGAQVGAGQPQVLKHAILDAGGQPVAVAEIKGVQTVQVNGGKVQVPTRVSLEWPPQKFKMELALGRVSVNEALSAEEQAFFFNRPNIRGATPINLATANFRPSSYRGAAPEGRRRGLFGGLR